MSKIAKPNEHHQHIADKLSFLAMSPIYKNTSTITYRNGGTGLLRAAKQFQQLGLVECTREKVGHDVIVSIEASRQNIPLIAEAVS